MIDVESQVFTAVYNAVIAQYPLAEIVGEAEPFAAKFPCVTVVEDDNSTYERTLDADAIERHAQIAYTVNVYSNLASGAKTQSKTIMAIVDGVMQGMGFVRRMNQPIPNADEGIYRRVARYDGILSENYTMYRR